MLDDIHAWRRTGIGPQPCRLPLAALRNSFTVANSMSSATTPRLLLTGTPWHVPYFKEAEEDKIRAEYLAQGIRLPEHDKSETFDSNTITPGTPFMARLSVALQYYIHKRVNEDPGWKNIKVILSDANSPGEGEHKFMGYIRLQRGLPGWDPNTKHVIYGLDADLIMLGIATHEAHFYILREQVTFGKPAQGPKRNKGPDNLVDQATEEKEKEENVPLKPYQFLVISVLREYLRFELTPAEKLPFPEDFERALDDFVFMCFFVGNDFLPHMPTLEIREGAIVLLMNVYKKVLPRLGGYLCRGSDIRLDRVEKFIQHVGQYEDAIFSKRHRMLQRQKQRHSRQKRDKMGRISDRAPGTVPKDLFNLKKSKSQPAAFGTNQGAAAELRAKLAGQKRAPSDGELAQGQEKKAKSNSSNVTDSTFDEIWASWEALKATSPSAAQDWLNTESVEAGNAVLSKEMEVKPEAMKVCEALLRCSSDVKTRIRTKANETGDCECNKSADEENEEEENSDELEARLGEVQEILKERLDDKNDLMDQIDQDHVRLAEAGWRERYYESKFHVQGEQQAKLKEDVVKSYIEGLVWVMKYYYEGVCSWTWYYPYHYAPFASDLKGISKLKITFEKGQPFKPFDQLMGVLPAASAPCLPSAYQKLMTDESSPIKDFYPEKFDVDMNGKRFAWQGVVLLPFINEARLLAATDPLWETLTDEEKRRNSTMLDLLYVHGEHPLATAMIDQAEKAKEMSNKEKSDNQLAIDPASSGCMNGFIVAIDGEVCPRKIHSPFNGHDDIVDNQVHCAAFKNPPYHAHESRILPGAVLPRNVVTEQDYRPSKLWHEDRRQAPDLRHFHSSPNMTYQQGRGVGGAVHPGYTMHPSSTQRPHSVAAAHQMLERSLNASGIPGPGVPGSYVSPPGMPYHHPHQANMAGMGPTSWAQQQPQAGTGYGYGGYGAYGMPQMHQQPQQPYGNQYIQGMPAQGMGPGSYPPGQTYPPGRSYGGLPPGAPRGGQDRGYHDPSNPYAALRPPYNGQQRPPRRS